MISKVFSDSCCYYRPAVLVGRPIRLVGQPFKLSRTPSKMVAPPPEFGEQTEEVLAEFGFSAGEIAELRKAKVV
jgi:crotonobetainyl-CoA:carnitine CoA-transferase CaiB-like acyl-CoA transferase